MTGFQFNITKTIVILLLIMSFFGFHSEAIQLNSNQSLFNIATVGDWACNANTQNTVKSILTKKPELVLALGDLSYQKNPDCWFKVISPLNNITAIVRGDHDNDFRMAQYMKHFDMAREFYSFNRGNMHILVLSTEAPYELGSDQYEFVKSDLENASTNSNVNWIIVSYHQPAYISPTNCKGCSPRVTLRELYHPLFDKYGVDLVLQAHDHSYERSYPIMFNSQESNSPIIVNKNQVDYKYSNHTPHGIIFVTVGTGGGDLNMFQGKAPYIARQYRGFGFLNIDVTNNGTTLSCSFYANDGTLPDQFNIDK